MRYTVRQLQSQPLQRAPPCPPACRSVQKDLRQSPLAASRALAPATHHCHLTVADCFSAVEQQALAAASIAQVGSGPGSPAAGCVPGLHACWVCSSMLEGGAGRQDDGGTWRGGSLLVTEHTV